MVTELVQQMVGRIKELVKDKAFIDEYKSRKTDFQRASALSFEKIVFFILGLSGNNLSVEALNFEDVTKINVTCSAFCQRRDAVQYTAIEAIFKEISDMIPVVNKFKGYQLLAYDGLKGELPNYAPLKPKYLASEKANYPTFHAVAEYDVLNCYYRQVVFEAGVTDERNAAVNLLEKSAPTNNKEIILLDRGFPSVGLIQAFQKQQNKYFVMRVSNSFLIEVNAFKTGMSMDETIHINYTQRRARLSGAKGLELPYSFDLRCVKLILSTGAQEILITNLPQSEFTVADLGELYNLRWKIEISFLHLKDAVRIEDFTGKKENSIKQEFFAALVKANILMLMTSVSDELIHKEAVKKKLKYDYKTVIRKAADILVPKFLAILTATPITSLLDSVIKRFTKFSAVIKPGRSFPRKTNAASHSAQYRHVVGLA